MRTMVAVGAVLAIATVTANSRYAAAEENYEDAGWISRQGRRNAAGEFCCGIADCYVVPSQHVKITAQGYRLMPAGAENEIVPYPEAQRSPDGRYWRCRRPDGTRRCFFAPPPAM